MNDLQLLICNENKIPRDFFIGILKDLFDRHAEIPDRTDYEDYINELLYHYYKCKKIEDYSGSEYLHFDTQGDKIKFVLKFNI